MKQPIITILKSLLSLCLVLVITNCNQTNDFTATPYPLSLTSSDEILETLTEPTTQEQMALTQTPFAAGTIQIETPISFTNAAEEEDPQEVQMCIVPFSEFAYSGAMDIHSSIQQPVLPLAPWEEVIDLGNTKYHYLALVRQYKGEGEIWVKNFDDDKIIIFKPETQEQQVISAKQIDYPGMTISPAFMQSDGTIWGQNYVYGENNEILYDPYPPLSRYNEETQRFEILKDMFTIPIYQEYMAYQADPLIFLDENDVFWVFAQHDGLYQYDTRTGETKKVLHTPDLEFRNGVMDQQGGIYFNRPTIGYYPIEGLKSGEILYFNPALGKLESLATPDQDWPAVLGLFIDPEDRLWTDISGYRDADGKWTLLHENIDEYFKNFNMLQSWQVPSIETQTSDGRFWVEREYSYYNQGTAWFDPKTGEGCWFTSYTSKIVEDANHRLWFEADGKLYKYDLLP